MDPKISRLQLSFMFKWYSYLYPIFMLHSQWRSVWVRYDTGMGIMSGMQSASHCEPVLRSSTRNTQESGSDVGNRLDFYFSFLIQSNSSALFLHALGSVVTTAERGDATMTTSQTHFSKKKLIEAACRQSTKSSIKFACLPYQKQCSFLLSSFSTTHVFSQNQFNKKTEHYKAIL